eukprot:5098506-Prymnesium_polylepis.1
MDGCEYRTLPGTREYAPRCWRGVFCFGERPTENGPRRKARCPIRTSRRARIPCGWPLTGRCVRVRVQCLLAVRAMMGVCFTPLHTRPYKRRRSPAITPASRRPS